MARKKAVVVEEVSHTLTDEEKRKRIDTIASTIMQKSNIVIGRLSDEKVKEKLKIEFIPNPSVNLNAATWGGFPKGKMTILSGTEDSGKTSLVLETIGKLHRENPEGHFALWIESEASLSLDYLINTFGIDPERFYYIQYDREHAAEDCLNQAEAIINSGVIDIFCINTLKALVPKSEILKSMEDVSVASGFWKAYCGDAVWKLSKLLEYLNNLLATTESVKINVNAVERQKK